MIECLVIDQENNSVAMSLQANPAVGDVINLPDGWGVVRRVEHSDCMPIKIHIDKAR